MITNVRYPEFGSQEGKAIQWESSIYEVDKDPWIRKEFIRIMTEFDTQISKFPTFTFKDIAPILSNIKNGIGAQFHPVFCETILDTIGIYHGLASIDKEIKPKVEKLFNYSKKEPEPWEGVFLSLELFEICFNALKEVSHREFKGSYAVTADNRFGLGPRQKSVFAGWVWAISQINGSKYQLLAKDKPSNVKFAKLLNSTISGLSLPNDGKTLSNDNATASTRVRELYKSFILSTLSTRK